MSIMNLARYGSRDPVLALLNSPTAKRNAARNAAAQAALRTPYTLPAAVTRQPSKATTVAAGASASGTRPFPAAATRHVAAVKPKPNPYANVPGPQNNSPGELAGFKARCDWHDMSATQRSAWADEDTFVRVQKLEAANRIKRSGVGAISASSAK